MKSSLSFTPTGVYLSLNSCFFGLAQSMIPKTTAWLSFHSSPAALHLALGFPLFFLPSGAQCSAVLFFRWPWVVFLRKKAKIRLSQKLPDYVFWMRHLVCEGSETGEILVSIILQHSFPCRRVDTTLLGTASAWCWCCTCAELQMLFTYGLAQSAVDVLLCAPSRLMMLPR